MKIRIKGNSLRYRLTKSEVEGFAESGYLEEVIIFVSNSLIYALERSHAARLSANFEQNKITLFMPGVMIDEWFNTERTGFENFDGNLYLLVEKDFKCLDEVSEDQSDNYPNPLSAAKKIIE